MASGCEKLGHKWNGLEGKTEFYIDPKLQDVFFNGIPVKVQKTVKAFTRFG